ncbi:MAG TPA: hypothetical protein VGS13_13545, partial [Stellaceae bacterium]|nr:hypothetical protein [Stellaceae bacterium]
MIRKRTIGILAALGGPTVALALLLGVPAAKADDTNLQANPELAQRLDQLAQVGTAKPQVPAGTATIAGSFPRSFLIPGTDTSLLVGGQLELDAGYWFSGGNNNNVGAGSPIAGVPGLSGVPLNFPGNIAKSRTNGIFNPSVYASRLHIETRTPTAYGQAQTVLEFDFLGCALGGIDCNNTVAGNDGLGARIRLAYATLGPFAAGQMWNPAADLASFPETLDLGCCAGLYGVGRLPEVVWTTDVPAFAGIPPSTFAFALIDPEDSAATPGGQTLTNNTNLQNVSLAGVAFGINPATGLPFSQANTNAGLLGTLNPGSNQLIGTNPLKTEWPDPEFAWTWQQPWGHLQLHGVVHQAAMVDGAHIDQQYIGYGGGVSGDVKPGWLGWQKDDIGFGAWAGNGLGRYAGGGGAGNYFPYLATNYGAPVGALGNTTGNPCGYGHLGVPSVGPGSAACAAGVRAQTIPEWGTEIWYQHWWTPTLRSTLDFGVAHQDGATALVGGLAAAAAAGGSTNGAGVSGINKALVNVHLNLLWSPVPFINTG